MFCSNCGAELKESDVTCPYCGMLQPAAAIWKRKNSEKKMHLQKSIFQN